MVPKTGVGELIRVSPVIPDSADPDYTGPLPFPNAGHTNFPETSAPGSHSVRRGTMQTANDRFGRIRARLPVAFQAKFQEPDPV